MLIEWQSEPLLYRGRRAWLLAANVALGAACGVSIARRMRRRGFGPGSTMLAATITVLAGVLAFWFLRVLLPSRAAARSVAPSKESHELLIQSA
jgi:hypothetical protein